MLPVEVVISYAEFKGSCLDYPEVGRDPRIEEKQSRVRKGIAFKTDLCRYYAVGVRGVVDGSRCGGSELCAVLAVKYYAVDRIGVGRAVLSVEHYVSYRDLAEKRLSPCFRADDA